MLSTGLRRSEVVDIDVNEYNVATGDLLVAHGKGDKQRIVYVSEEAATHMKAWLRTRGQQQGKLFLPIHNKQIINRKMSSQSIYDLVGKRAREARTAVHMTCAGRSSPVCWRQGLIFIRCHGLRDIPIFRRLRDMTFVIRRSNEKR